MFYRQVILLFLTMCIYTHFNVAKEYGLAKLRVSKYEQCKGPKRIDCCSATLSLDGLVITQHLNVMENIHLTHGKVVGYSNAKQVMKFPTEKPCHNILVNYMFKKYINITDDCTVPKGHYVLVVDLEDVLERFYNNQFLYGNLTVKSSYYSEKCNFLCTILEMEILPRNKQ